MPQRWGASGCHHLLTASGTPGVNAEASCLGCDPRLGHASAWGDADCETSVTDTRTHTHTRTSASHCFLYSGCRNNPLKYTFLLPFPRISSKANGHNTSARIKSDTGAESCRFQMWCVRSHYSRVKLEQHLYTKGWLLSVLLYLSPCL